MKVYEASITYAARDLPASQLPILDDPAKVVEFIRPAFEPYPEQEAVICIALDRKNRVKCYSVISTGTLTSSLMHPREIFRFLCLSSASAFILCHNHPSGDPTPSRGDIQVTRLIREAAKTMNMDFLDHVIVGDQDADPRATGFHSFQEEGLL